MLVGPEKCKGIDNWWAILSVQSRREGCRDKLTCVVNDLMVQTDMTIE